MFLPVLIVKLHIIITMWQQPISLGLLLRHPKLRLVLSFGSDEPTDVDRST